MTLQDRRKKLIFPWLEKNRDMVAHWYERLRPPSMYHEKIFPELVKAGVYSEKTYWKDTLRSFCQHVKAFSQ